MIMYQVYVLKSLKNGKRYVGFTLKEPLCRLREHNEGKNSFTRRNRPFELIYSENFDTELGARKREKFFKTGYGRNALLRIIPP